METVHIRQQLDSKGKASFNVSAVSLQSPQGVKKLIPHPYGQEVAPYLSLEEAVQAVHRAGYDAEFDGLAYYKPDSPMRSARPIATGASVLTLETILQKVNPLLQGQLKDKSPGVVASAALALGELGKDDAIPALIECFGHDDATIRRHAADAIAKIGTPAVPALRQALKHGHWLMRHSALCAVSELLVRYPDIAMECLNDSVMLLKDENWLVRSQSAQVFADAARVKNARSVKPGS